MTIDQLRSLIWIHRLGSINKASEQMHISQQALSTSMKKLESEVGHDLLIRNTNGVALTENGRTLEKFAEEMLQKLDKTLTTMESVDMPFTKQKEKLQVFFSPIIGNTCIADISKIFAHHHPLTQLLVMERETSEILELITKSNASALGLLSLLVTPPRIS